LSTFIKEHPAVLITLSYAYLSFVGVLYEYFHMMSYGINVLNYIEPKDYLISFTKAVPFLLIVLVGYVLTFIKDILFNQRHVPAKTFKERVIVLLVKSRKMEVVFLLVSLPFLASVIGSSSTKKLESYNTITISKKLATELNISNPLYLINSFGQYFFLSSESKKFIVRKDKLNGFEVVRYKSLKQGK
jgi:hypothetical protein